MLPKPGKQIFTETQRKEASGCGSTRSLGHHIESKKSLMNQLYRYYNVLKKEKPKKTLFFKGHENYAPSIS